MTIDQAVRAILPEVHQIGSDEGPVVSILGGVHGNELLGVLAVRRLVGAIDPTALRGRIRWAAPAHPAAWVAEVRAGPADGVNLARVFPGDPTGGPTERVAAHLTDALITGSDLLVDLHTAGSVSDMPLLCGYHSQGPLADAAAAAAAAFCAPFTWLHPEVSPGRSLSAAEELGIPSIYVESAGGMVVRQRELQCYVDGLLRVLRLMGMVDSAPEAGCTPVTVVGDGNTDGGLTSPSDGYFVSDAVAGDLVRDGDSIGVLLDEAGRTSAIIRADGTGHLMLLRLASRVAHGDTLALIAAAQ